MPVITALALRTTKSKLSAEESDVVAMHCMLVSCACLPVHISLQRAGQRAAQQEAGVA
jgi:hypothetical protein